MLISFGKSFESIKWSEEIESFKYVLLLIRDLKSAGGEHLVDRSQSWSGWISFLCGLIRFDLVRNNVFMAILASNFRLRVDLDEFWCFFGRFVAFFSSFFCFLVFFFFSAFFDVSPPFYGLFRCFFTVLRPLSMISAFSNAYLVISRCFPAVFQQIQPISRIFCFEHVFYDV